jgi:hypothetical protein
VLALPRCLNYIENPIVICTCNLRMVLAMAPGGLGIGYRPFVILKKLIEKNGCRNDARLQEAADTVSEFCSEVALCAHLFLTSEGTGWMRRYDLPVGRSERPPARRSFALMVVR